MNKEDKEAYTPVTAKMTRGVKVALLRGLQNGGFDNTDTEIVKAYLGCQTITVEVVEAKEEIKRLEELRNELNIKDNE